MARLPASAAYTTLLLVAFGDMRHSGGAPRNARGTASGSEHTSGCAENVMQAMVLNQPGAELVWTELADRQPGPGEIRVQVAACGVCRTDLHVVDGELPHPTVPIIPGHEIVGRIDAIGAGVEGLQIGERVGVPWLGHTCGVCPYCVGGQENLCDHPLFTGYTRDGGFATAVIADRSEERRVG